MIRFLTTMATLLFLSSAYFLYGAFVVPLTVALKLPDDQLVPQTSGYEPPVLSGIASTYFSDVEWLHSGDIKTFQTSETFFYTRDVKRDEQSGNKVFMSPIAILWKDERSPESKPYRLIATKGIIQFENQFFDSAINLTDSNPGRIVWGTLEGLVHIDGPDGLVIDGKQFVFSEQSGQLYSDYPVSFHYGPTAQDQTEVTGTADQLNISLTPSDEPILGKDMPRVGGISLLTLRRNVQLDAIYYQQGVRHDARLTCDGPFEYDVPNRRALFSNTVRVNHVQPQGDRHITDTLESERLQFQFEPSTPQTTPASPSSGKLLDDMTLSEVRALGSTGGLGGRSSRVFIRSEQYDLVAIMQDLTYNLLTRTATFLDPKQVVVKRGGSTFACPNISLVHGESKSLEKLLCRGPGQLLVTHEKFGESHAEASWKGQLNVTPDPQGPLHIIELQRNAQVYIPEIVGAATARQYQLGLAANVLRLWVDLEQAQNLQSETQILLQELPVHRAEAVGDVALVSSDLIIERSNRIDVNLSPSVGPVTENSSEKSEVTGVGYQEERNPSTGRRDFADPIRLAIDEIHIDLLHHATTGKIAVKQIDGQGNVTMTHQPKANQSVSKLGGDGPLVLRGTRIVAESDNPADQKVTLMGVVDEYGKVTTPAELEFGLTRIKGANLTLDRQRNQIAILGAGAFQIPVSKDLNGKPLDRPATLEVVWQERMTFNGLDAIFLDDVSCSLKGHQDSISRMLCEDLTVRLTQKILLNEQHQNSDRIEVEFIHGKYGVELESNEYEGSKLIGARRGKLAEFHINQSTGKFVGLGPGEIHAWTLGDTVKLSPTDSAEANQPIKPDENTKWRYSRLEFSGKLTGDIDQKSAEFNKQRIKILTAPVDQALMKFREDDVALVSNAVRLDCRSLKLFQREFDGRGHWEIFAQSVNDLEGQLFRAVADELSFDERLGRFILRGIGKDATLYFQERPGVPFSPSSHRYIEFIPKKRSITVDGSSGLSG